MKLSGYYISLLLLVLVGVSAQAETRYATVYNHFSSLFDENKAQITDNVLRVSNDSDQPKFLLDTVSVTVPAFRFYLRLQNYHSKEGHSYKVLKADGTHAKVACTETGIMLKSGEDDYWTATYRLENTDRFNDVTDRRLMTVSLRHMIHGVLTFAHDTTLSHDVNLSGGFNVIGIDVTQDEITVSVGEKRLLPVLHAPLPPLSTGCFVGACVGPGAEVGIERAVLSYTDEAPTQIMTQWTRERLDEHFAQSKNPYEGYWVYLDRDLEDKWLRLGGRYTVALVETNTGYDIIYVDGALVKKSQWLPGMLKGRMKNTIFADNYSAMWIDATFKPFDLDVTASFESGVILTINFPVYQSQVRFSKVLE